MTAFDPTLAARIAGSGIPLSVNLVQDAASSVEYLYREERFEVMFPAAGASDLTDPITRRTLSPASVRLEMVRRETPDEGVREWAHVAVHGPRRLVSGELGREISSFGWQAASVRGSVLLRPRPEWLTALLVEHRPDGWSASLLDLPAGGVR